MDEERVSDPYRARDKWPEPTTCPECGAIIHHGQWRGERRRQRPNNISVPRASGYTTRVPAGQLTLSGEFFAEHREEILHLVRHAESKARAEQPLERIMDFKEETDHIMVTFTDSPLVHGIGEALHHAYHGKLGLTLHGRRRPPARRMEPLAEAK